MDRTRTIRIMRPGTFTSVEGKSVTFGPAELQAIVDGYDATSDPAPLVVGHPKMDDPAYGWIGRLSIENGELVAHPASIDRKFESQVRKGDYRKVSAQFYEPDNPHNPKPGQFYLKHVGFLGAHAPGVKGLGTVQFAAGEGGSVATIETETPAKEQAVAKETEDKQNDNPNNNDAARAQDREASFAERETTLAQREAAIEARERKAAEDAAAARHAANVSFAEGLVKDAKLAPAGKDLVIGVLDSLGDDAGKDGEDGKISFGEGDKAVKMTPAAAFKKLFEGAGTIVSFGEAAPARKGKASGAIASFAAPAGYSVDENAAALHAEAKRLQTATPGRPWMDCVREAQASLGA